MQPNDYFMQIDVDDRDRSMKQLYTMCEKILWAPLGWKTSRFRVGEVRVIVNTLTKVRLAKERLNQIERCFGTGKLCRERT